MLEVYAALSSQSIQQVSIASYKHLFFIWNWFRGNTNNPQRQTNAINDKGAVNLFSQGPAYLVSKLDLGKEIQRSFRLVFFSISFNKMLKIQAMEEKWKSWPWFIPNFCQLDWAFVTLKPLVNLRDDCALFLVHKELHNTLMLFYRLDTWSVKHVLYICEIIDCYKSLR